MNEVIAWPNAGGVVEPLPKPLMRPCDYALLLAVKDLETQLGTIEAYNRLVRAAEGLKARIERGDVKAQNPLYAVSVKG